MTDTPAATISAGEATVPDESVDVALAASGDGYAFERLYRTHAARIHSLVRRMTSPEHADDLTQEIFVRVWEKLDTYRGESAFGTWLHRLAVNFVLSARAKLARERQRFQSGERLVAAAPARPATPGIAIDLEAAIETLPDGARQVFVLHDVEGYKHKEIADLLGIASGTSKAQLHRARMLLRQQLTAEKERA